MQKEVITPYPGSKYCKKHKQKNRSEIEHNIINIWVPRVDSSGASIAWGRCLWRVHIPASRNLAILSQSGRLCACRRGLVRKHVLYVAAEAFAEDIGVLCWSTYGESLRCALTGVAELVGLDRISSS